MGRISTGIGLISGINSKDIIDQLIQIEQQPKVLLQSRKDKVDAQKQAYNDILTQLSTLQSAGRTFERPSTFTASTAQSSDENVLTATTSAGAAIGSYQFQVARLVTAQQSVTAGFADTSTAVGAGNLTIELGGGNLNAQTPLSQLNGGAGVRRGQFRITDRSGKSAVIDVSSAVTVDDAIKKINTSLDISVRASVKGDQIILTDGTGAAVNDLKVEDLGDGHAAADLGIAGSAAAPVLSGADVVYLGNNLSLTSLNDGRGVRVNSASADFIVTARDGSTTNVTLGATVKSLADVIKAINTAGGSKFKAQLSGTGNGLQLIDTTGGGGAFTVAAASPTSYAAQDLGLAKTTNSNTLDGDNILAGLDTVLVSSLKGGTGLPLGQISITDRAGNARPVDLTAAKTVQDILDTINSTPGLLVTASLKASSNGIQITDKSGGTGNLVISDVDSTTAVALGIAGTFNTTQTAALGANLQPQWVSENTQLSTFNGGKGVTPGVFTITNSAGRSIDVNLTTGSSTKLGDVISAINAASAGVSASINANGDGLLLTDTAGGAGKLKVENKTGTTATDLNILGTATGTTIDGSFEKTLDVTATDTLASVQSKLQTLGFGVSANIINDGSGQSPYRLSLTAFNPGLSGRVVFDAGTSGLAAQNLVEAQDAAVFYGGTGSAQPLLLTSSKNQLANVIPGVTIALNGVSNSPVTLNVTRDADSVVDQVQKFVDGFNGIVDKIADLTKYDSDTQQAGLLLGDSTIQDVQTQLYVALQGVVQGAGQYRILADVGITLTDGAKLEFDADKFRSTFADDPIAVKNLFTQTSGTVLTLDTPLTQLNSGQGLTTNPAGDFRVTTKDGSHFDVSLATASTIADVLSEINDASGGKVTADISSNGKGLRLTDNTAGTGSLSVGLLNGSLAANQLGLSSVAVGNILTGTNIFIPSTATGGGIGYLVEQSMKKLIDPVDGVISRENQTLDLRAQQFQDRMDTLDKLIASKRTRLEEQFANMESVLAGLQNQQAALGSLGSIATTTTKASTSSSK